MSTDIYDYARELDNNEHITYYDVYKVLLNNIDCIVCKESSADLLGYSNGGFRSKIEIYTQKNYDLPFLNCHIVSDLSKIPVQDYDGIKVVPIEETIIDLLQDDSADPQIILESMSDYYFTNNESFEKIKFPNIKKEKLDFFIDGAIHYYDTY